MAFKRIQPYQKMTEKDYLRPFGKGKPLLSPTEWATLCLYRRTFNK